ncbi:MAG: hypothetical protein ROR55_11460 [Devosia sp.]
MTEDRGVVARAGAQMDHALATRGRERMDQPCMERRFAIVHAARRLQDEQDILAGVDWVVLGQGNGPTPEIEDLPGIRSEKRFAWDRSKRLLKRTVGRRLRQREHQPGVSCANTVEIDVGHIVLQPPNRCHWK